MFSYTIAQYTWVNTQIHKYTHIHSYTLTKPCAHTLDTYMCKYILIYTFTYMYELAYLRVHRPIHTYICTETHMCTYTSMHTYAQRHMCMHTYPCIFICRDTHTYPFIDRCAHLSMHIYVYMYMHAHTYPCTPKHIDTRTHTPSLPLSASPWVSCSSLHWSCSSCPDKSTQVQHRFSAFPCTGVLKTKKHATVCGRIPSMLRGCSWPLWQVSDKHQKSHSKVSENWQATVSGCFKDHRNKPLAAPNTLCSQLCRGVEDMGRSTMLLTANKRLPMKTDWKTLRQRWPRSAEDQSSWGNISSVLTA